jgi:hypothetical protein
MDFKVKILPGFSGLEPKTKRPAGVVGTDNIIDFGVVHVLGFQFPAKIERFTLMCPFHGNL